MTRINLIPPAELADQHLMAEYRELPMVSAALRRSLRTRKQTDILKNIPAVFTLNRGHVLFFYDKLLYLENRYNLLVDELLQRGFVLTKDRPHNLHGLPDIFYNDYRPTDAAYEIIRKRIAEKIALKPDWYRFR